MTDWLAFAVAVLATWRLAAALYYEEGPWRIWIRLRVYVQARSAFWQGQLSCFWCCTVWAALVIWPAYVWAPWLLVPLALSGAAMLLTCGGRIIWRAMAEEG